MLKITNDKERNDKNKMAKTHDCIGTDFTVADKRAEAAMASMTSCAIALIISITLDRKGVETSFLRQKCKFTVTFA